MPTPTRIDFCVNLYLFASAADVARAAFEHYRAHCEAQVEAGNEYPFSAHRLAVSNLIKQLDEEEASSL